MDNFTWAYNVGSAAKADWQEAMNTFRELRERKELAARRARGEDVRTDLEKRIDSVWEVAARQYAIRDVLVMELARIAPNHPLNNAELRAAIADAGEARYIKMGRKDLDDAGIASAGELTSLQEKFKKLAT